MREKYAATEESLDFLKQIFEYTITYNKQMGVRHESSSHLEKSNGARVPL